MLNYYPLEGFTSLMLVSLILLFLFSPFPLLLQFFETFSFLPPLSADEISKQVRLQHQLSCNMTASAFLCSIFLTFYCIVIVFCRWITWSATTGPPASSSLTPPTPTWATTTASAWVPSPPVRFILFKTFLCLL